MKIKFTGKKSIKRQARDAAYKLLDGKLTQKRFDRLVDIYLRLTPKGRRNLRLETCAHGGADPYRFGKSACRVGKCERIGYVRMYGNKRYQLWAVWN